MLARSASDPFVLNEAADCSARLAGDRRCCIFVLTGLRVGPTLGQGAGLERVLDKGTLSKLNRSISNNRSEGINNTTKNVV